MRVRVQDTIEATPEAVFRFFDDLANASELVPRLIEITEVEPLPNGGKRVQYVTRGRDGKLSNGTSEHVEYEPFSRVVVRNDVEGLTSVSTRNFEAVARGTRVTVDVEYTILVPALGRLIERQWKRHSRRELRRVLVTAKSRLERADG